MLLPSRCFTTPTAGYTALRELLSLDEVVARESKIVVVCSGQAGYISQNSYLATNPVLKHIG